MKAILRILWLVKMTLVEYRRWRGLSRGDKPRVFYGYDRLPGRSELVSGGIIKCQDLEIAFPNSPDSPNLLYLVSSVLPPHLPILIRAAKRAGMPIVLNQNGVAYPAWHGAGWEKTNCPLALAYHAADYVFYQSDFCRVGAERFLGTRQGNGEVLFNPVDTSVFTPLPSQRFGAPVILISGSHQFRYRLETAVLALAELRRHYPDATMIVAGRYCWNDDEDRCRSEIYAVAGDAGVADAIDWRGAYTQEMAPALMREGNVLLHTKYNDPCPRLVVEAMACGLPIVYSNSGGVPELVGPDAGIGVPSPCDWERDHPPEPLALAAALRAVLSRHAEMSVAARQRAVAVLDVNTWRRRHAEVFGLLTEKHICPESSREK